MAGKEINTELELKITHFTAFIKNIKPQLKNFKNMTKRICESRWIYNGEFLKFSKYLLPEYEKSCIQKYSQEEQNQDEGQKDLPVNSQMQDNEQITNIDEFSKIGTSGFD